MAIEIPFDSNHLMLTQYRSVRGTGIVPLLRPTGFTASKASATHVTLPIAVEKLASHNGGIVDKVPGLTLTGEGGVLAVLDSGVYGEHIDFGGRLLLSTNFKGDTLATADIHDMHGHGTHVAGLAVAGKSKRVRGFSGIAPKASFISVKVTEGDHDVTSWKRIADGLEWVLTYNEAPSTKPYSRVSCVLICFNGYDTFTTQQTKNVQNNRLIKLFEDCYNSGVTVVVSSGNHYLDFCSVTSPARIPGVAISDEPVVTEHTGLAYPAVSKFAIAVGATANDDGTYTLRRPDMHGTMTFSSGDMAIFSQRKRNVRSTTVPNPLFVCAPGMQMVSLDHRPENIAIHGTYPQGYTVMSGTSQAAAIMAGMVLLLQEEYRKEHAGSDTRVPADVIQKAINVGSVQKDFDSMGHTRRSILAATDPQFKIFDLKSAINYIKTH